MEIKDIKQFIDWCQQEPSTYEQRKELFQKQRATVEAEIEHMNKVPDMLKFKCWFYEQAIEQGGDTEIRKLLPTICPRKFRRHTITHIAERKEPPAMPGLGTAGESCQD